MPSIAVIVPSSSRPSLKETVASIVPQLEPGDQLLVDVNAENDFGNAARRRMVPRAHTDLLMFQDDDDVYRPEALALAREAAVEYPERVLIFRMIYLENMFALWDVPELREGNVASQMLCVPNIPEKLGQWSDRYESDFDFISSSCIALGEPVFLENIISLVHHPRVIKEELVAAD